MDTLKDYEKHVCIIADEMKIKEGLVFNKNTNEMIGFTNLGDMNDAIENIQNKKVPWPLQCL